MVCSCCGTAVKPGADWCDCCGAALKYPCANGGGSTSPGINPNLAASLAYLLGWVSGLVFYLIAKNSFVRFHALQSILVFGFTTAVLAVLGGLRGLLRWAYITAGGGYTAWGLLGLLSTAVLIGSLVLWAVLILKANRGERYKVPLAGDIAEKWLR